LQRFQQKDAEIQKLNEVSDPEEVQDGHNE
jgi:hypothetical protein